MAVLKKGLLLWRWAHFFYKGPESKYLWARRSLLFPLPLLLKQNNMKLMGFPGRSVVKNLPANARDLGLIPGSERSPGGGNGNPLAFFPEESHDRGAGGLQSMGLQRVGHG